MDVVTRLNDIVVDFTIVDVYGIEVEEKEENITFLNLLGDYPT